jgi:hypothetical protein
VTFQDASSRADEIKLLAFEMAGQFRRLVTIEVDGGDVVVSFFVSAA